LKEGTDGTRGRTPASSRGFTLLEVMMVVVLILIVLGVSTVFLARRLPSQNLNSAGRELSAMLRFAKLLAKNSGEPRAVLVNLDSGRYGIAGVQMRNVPQGVTLTITDPLEGEITRGEHSIVFNESGTAGWGRITLSGGRKVLHIELDPVLGAVVLKK
jgi:general secretion pathway protein H